MGKLQPLVVGLPFDLALLQRVGCGLRVFPEAHSAACFSHRRLQRSSGVKRVCIGPGRQFCQNWCLVEYNRGLSAFPAQASF